MDRIDIRLAVSRPADAELDGDPGERSGEVRSRVIEARARAARRLAGCPWRLNAHVPAAQLRRHWTPDPDGAEVLAQLERRAANLRGPDRILRVAWTIADLQGHARPGRDDVAQAIGLRGSATEWAR